MVLDANCVSAAVCELLEPDLAGSEFLLGACVETLSVSSVTALQSNSEISCSEWASFVLGLHWQCSGPAPGQVLEVCLLRGGLVCSGILRYWELNLGLLHVSMCSSCLPSPSEWSFWKEPLSVEDCHLTKSFSLPRVLFFPSGSCRNLLTGGTRISLSF